MPSGDVGYFVICPAPTGPSLLATLRPWPEADLTDFLLKPAAMALAELQDRDVTHRAIRADNVFQPAPRTPVVLGCAWASPPACYQPNWMEPPSSAICLPTGRGDGRIADDVYSLGALMVMLALGFNPVEGVAGRRSPAEQAGAWQLLLRWSATTALPSTLVDLVRGMLADDPEHRPSPSPVGQSRRGRARSQDCGPVRPAAPSDRSRSAASWLGPIGCWPTRCSGRRRVAGPMLRNGTIDRWLRRGVGDVSAAASIDEASRMRDAEVLGGGRPCRRPADHPVHRHP